MAKIKFTDDSIAALKPQAKRIEYFDSAKKPRGQKGSLGIRVLPTGNMVWFIMYHNQFGKIRRFNIGNYPDFSLFKAKHEADGLLMRIKEENFDPQEERNEEKLAPQEEIPTMTDLWELYQEELKERKRPKAHNTTRQEIGYWERRINPKIGNKKVRDVRPVHLTNMLKDMATVAPISSNRLHALLGILFQPAVEQGWIDVSPMHAVRKKGGQETGRRRFLSDDEIRSIWPNLDRIEETPRDQIKLGLLTAQRPGEIAGMKWADLDLDKGTWFQADNKTDEPFICPLSPQALEILVNRNNSKKRHHTYVFPAINRKDSLLGHAHPARRGRTKVQKLSGVTEWTNHDLRRTARSLLSRCRVEHHIRERCLNHSLGKIESTYDVHDYYREKQIAFNKLADKLDKILGKESKAKVIDIQRTA